MPSLKKNVNSRIYILMHLMHGGENPLFFIANRDTCFEILLKAYLGSSKPEQCVARIFCCSTGGVKFDKYVFMKILLKIIFVNLTRK